MLGENEKKVQLHSYRSVFRRQPVAEPRSKDNDTDIVLGEKNRVDNGIYRSLGKAIDCRPRTETIRFNPTENGYVFQTRGRIRLSPRRMPVTALVLCLEGGGNIFWYMNTLKLQ